MNGRAHFPPKLNFLFQPARVKVLYGGRGGAKSWGIARALLIIAAQRFVRILCVRQTMKSIEESVHHLLESQIDALGLRGNYVVEKRGITCPETGSEFIFDGLQHNVSNIKSKEAIDICWVEEARDVTKHSWDTLIPTIRKDDSEIWVSFNPELDTDDTWRRWIIDPPPYAKVVKIGWQDNDWFPATLEMEREQCERTDPRSYPNIWEGVCRPSIEGAIYESELAAMEAGQRLTRVPASPGMPVNTAWDLGFGDGVAVWCWQQVGMEVRVLNYLENQRKAIDWYIRELQQLPYVWGTDYMPWDANGGQANLTGNSIADFARKLGRKVEVLPQGDVDARINALRVLFPIISIDANACADGVSMLRRYEWGSTVNKATNERVPRRAPLHNAASHASDALGYMAMALQTPRTKSLTLKPTWSPSMGGGVSWMG